MIKLIKGEQSVCCTRNWELLGGVSDCEELVGLLIGDDEVGISGVIPSHVRHEVFLRGKRYIIIHFLRNSFLLDNLMQF